MSRALVYAVLWQGSWLALVLGASTAWSLWITIASAAILLGWIACWGLARRDLMLMAEATWIGACFDGALAALGLVVYEPAGLWLVPPWILLLWMWLAGSLLHALTFLQRRLWLAPLFGLAGGPLAYFAGWRLGALELLRPSPAMVVLAVGYALAVTWLAWRARRPGLPGLRCWEEGCGRGDEKEVGRVV